MSGKKQTREEYFADISDGSLTYYTIGIVDPVVKVNGDTATMTYTSVLNADALAGKTLIPFSTHAGSGLADFDGKLASACPDSTIGMIEDCLFS